MQDEELDAAAEAYTGDEEAGRWAKPAPEEPNADKSSPPRPETQGPRRYLSEHHRQHLHASGLSDTTIDRGGFWTCDDKDEARRLLNWPEEMEGDPSGLVIPYPGFSGTYVKIRPDHPRPRARFAEKKVAKEPCRTDHDTHYEEPEDEEVEFIKYEAPRGQGLHCYIPLQLCPSICDPKKMLYLTEGEKKGLLMCQEGVPCVGLPGVSSAHDVEARDAAQDRGDVQREFVLIPELLPYITPKREVCLLFDTPDMLQNVNVIRGAVRTAKMVDDRGAVALVGYVPHVSGLTKVGIDDYFVETRRKREAVGSEFLDVLSSNFAGARPAQPLKQLEWLREHRDEGGLGKSELKSYLREMATWARVWHENAPKFFGRWVNKAAKEFGFEPSEINELAAHLKLGTKAAGGKWKNLSDEKLAQLCVPVLDSQFALFRAGDATERVFSVNKRREAKLQLEDAGVEKAAHDFLKAKVGGIPPAPVLARAKSIWRRELKPIAEEPQPFCFEGDDRLCFKRFDWEPKPGPHQAWDEFLTRLSDCEAFMAYVWSCFELENLGRQYVWLRGDGEDGKSTVLRVLQKVFGEAAAAVTGAALKEQRFLGSSIYGKRVVFYADCKNPRLGMSEFVRVCTTGDGVQIEFKGMTAFTANLRVKLFVASNPMPEVSSIAADQSRLILIEVDESKSKDDPMWETQLEVELPAFLWDCKRTYETLCPHHGNIRLNEESLRLRSDAAAAFEERFAEIFQAYLQVVPGAKLPAGDVQRLLQQAGFRDNDKVADFRAWMKREHGVEYKRTNAERYYLNLGRKPGTERPGWS